MRDMHALQQQLISDLRLAFADLHKLCAGGDVDCAWPLVSLGMGMKLREGEGAPLLQRATRGGKTRFLKFLIE